MRFFLWLGLAAAVVALDQWTKGLAQGQLDYGRPQALLPILNFTLQHNAGAAFSFLSDAGGMQRWLFSGIAVTVSIILVVWMSGLSRQEWLLSLGLALILGGAVGNLWDRLELGYVIDFISLHYRGHYFPTFNVADSAISAGAAVMIVDAILQPRRAGADHG